MDLGAVLVSHHHSLRGSGVSAEHHAVLHKRHTHTHQSISTWPNKNRNRPTYGMNTHLKDQPTDGGSGLPSRWKAVSSFGGFSLQMCISEKKNFNSFVKSVKAACNLCPFPSHMTNACGSCYKKTTGSPSTTLRTQLDVSKNGDLSRLKRPSGEHGWIGTSLLMMPAANTVANKTKSAISQWQL